MKLPKRRVSSLILSFILAIIFLFSTILISLETINKLYDREDIWKLKI